MGLVATHCASRRHLALLALGLGAAALTAFGWNLFWFLTDDAFIAFRYASNLLHGWGLVWNPLPFVPVEGYTSFLWVVLLALVWAVTGVAPPESANWLSLLFGYGTLYQVFRIFERMSLPEVFRRHRLTLFGLSLLGTVTNRTFLTWLSSGLETSLFNFCVTSWVYYALDADRGRGPTWVAKTSAVSTLLALTRPDGLLFCAATVLLVGSSLMGDRSRRRSLILAMLPLSLVPMHLIWRRLTYGVWLPNTFYAKVVGAWPESGARYLLSFGIENGLWVWVLLAVLAVACEGRRLTSLALAPLVVCGALATHAAYYTFVVGGDHFEYRVYSHLVPLFFVSAVWLSARGLGRPIASIGALALLLLASWPIPWVHWYETRDLVTRQQTHLLAAPIAQRFPGPLRPAIARWDRLQAWLIEHAVCIRHQEHKVFYEFMRDRLPSREEGSKVRWSDRALMQAGNIGVLGWVLPEVAIIDTAGLTDRIVARSPIDGSRERQMAHDRRPPEGYVQCFSPNAKIEGGALVFRARPLSDEAITGCEALGWLRIQQEKGASGSRSGL
jgi:arabinofuranosyltransferase